MGKLLITVLLGISCLMSAGIQASYAGEIDLLLQKLVEKGVLTGAEAQQVKIETQEQVKKEIATGKSASLPAWVQNMKLKGDLRLRYQNKHDKAANNYQQDTNIGRIRLRLGLEAKINDKLMAGIGIATGSGDPRSTNITFGSYNTKKSIVLDYGYAKYSPFPWLNLVGGKMLLGDALWEPTDLIWDTDITPEGAMLQFNTKLGSNANLFLNTGALIVDADSSSDNDAPMAYLIQPGVSYKLSDSLSLKGAVSLQSFSNVKNHVSSTYSGASNTGNTTAGTSSYAYDYQMINPALEIGFKEPFKAIGFNVESLKLLGEYVNNLDVSKASSGFSCGFKLGNDKIEKWGDWQIKYIYAMLGRDAVLDVLPDSDRYGGKTGIRSHEVEFQFGLAKNTFLGLDVYRSWRTYGAKAPETLVQVDWNMKF
ncbi:MAG: putative porin [Candidatus Omnitrophica bacterium]|nr:putative porin [Candidatus Omnitrophota bacterium]